LAPERFARAFVARLAPRGFFGALRAFAPERVRAFVRPLDRPFAFGRAGRAFLGTDGRDGSAMGVVAGASGEGIVDCRSKLTRSIVSPPAPGMPAALRCLGIGDPRKGFIRPIEPNEAIESVEPDED
jgi:hypothetical protein